MSVQAGAGATWKQSSLKSKVARDGAMMVLVKSATKTRMVAVATPEDPLVHCATRGSTRVFAKAIKIETLHAFSPLAPLAAHASTFAGVGRPAI